MATLQTRRLTTADRQLARTLFALMAEVFEEDRPPLSDDYLNGLLARGDFWVIAALIDGQPVGGLTAHTLPMTRAEVSELFVYDVAVHEDYQRQGIGRALMSAARDGARDAGIREVIVPADDEDVHALDFYRAIGGTPTPVTLFVFSDDDNPGAER